MLEETINSAFFWGLCGGGVEGCDFYLYTSPSFEFLSKWASGYWNQKNKSNRDIVKEIRERVKWREKIKFTFLSC